MKIEDLSVIELKAAIYDQSRVRNSADRNIQLLEKRLGEIENEEQLKLKNKKPEEPVAPENEVIKEGEVKK